jgi:hypothetical protein
MTLSPMYTFSPMEICCAISVPLLPFVAFGSVGVLSVLSVEMVTRAPILVFLPMAILAESSS